MDDQVQPIEQTQDSTIGQSITINGEEIALSDLAASPAAAKVLSAVLAQNEKEKIAAKLSYEDQIAELTKQKDQLTQTCNDQKSTIQNLQLQLTDAESKRDAASKALDEEKAEVERLKSQVDDLRKEIAVGARNAVNVVDAGDALEQFKKEREAEQAAKPAIYDVVPLDQKKSRYAAMTLDGEPIEFGYLDMGKYRVLQPQEVEQEVARFRAEQAQTSAANGQTDDNANRTLVIPPPPIDSQFQSQEVDTAAAGLSQTESSVESAGQTVEERLAELEIAVFGKAKGTAA